MDAREAILSRIVDPGGRELSEPYRLKVEVASSLLELFTKRLTDLGGAVVAWPDLAALPGRRWCIDASAGPLPPEAGDFEPATAWEADLGVTRALVGVAETGTLLVGHSEGDRRLASLAPPRHVAVLKETDLVRTLEEAVDRLPSGNSVLVTGPSRTADIEGVLVRGVHGPRDLWVIVEKN